MKVIGHLHKISNFVLFDVLIRLLRRIWKFVCLPNTRNLKKHEFTIRGRQIYICSNL